MVPAQTGTAQSNVRAGRAADRDRRRGGRSPGVVAVATLLLEPRRATTTSAAADLTFDREAAGESAAIRSATRRSASCSRPATPAAPRRGPPRRAELAALSPAARRRAARRGARLRGGPQRAPDRARPAAAGRRGRGRAAAFRARTGSLPPMPALRRFDVDELLTRPGTYFNPETEIVLVVDDSAHVDLELIEDEGGRRRRVDPARRRPGDRRAQARRAGRGLRDAPRPLRPRVRTRTRTSPTKRTSSSRTRTSSEPGLRLGPRLDEVEDDAEDDVDREELHALEPGRLAVLGDVGGDQHREQDRARSPTR